MRFSLLISNCLIWIGGVMIVGFTSQPLAAQTESAVMARIKHGRRTLYGALLGWDGKQIALLERDGRLHLVPANSRDDAKVTGDQYQPFTAEAIKQLLFQEYGPRYEVSKTAQFVVVHPWGDPRIWAQPFEDFHN